MYFGVAKHSFYLMAILLSFLRHSSLDLRLLKCKTPSMTILASIFTHPFRFSKVLIFFILIAHYYSALQCILLPGNGSTNGLPGICSFAPSFCKFLSLISLVSKH